MTYLIIAAVLLFIYAVRQTAKARHWKRKNKDIYRHALIEKHSLQHRIDQLEADRSSMNLFERLNFKQIRIIQSNSKPVERYFKILSQCDNFDEFVAALKTSHSAKWVIDKGKPFKLGLFKPVPN